MQAQSALLQCVLVSLTFLSAAQGQQARGSFLSGVDSQSSPDLETIIRNMEAAQEASRPQLPYEAVRDYRLLEGDASRINAEVVARITFMPPNVKNYSIQNHTGSSRGADVVRRILDKEASMTAQDPDASLRSISSQNYNFAYLGEGQLNDGRGTSSESTPSVRTLVSSMARSGLTRGLSSFLESRGRCPKHPPCC